MVGLVIVSHSARLAEGVVELAAQMADPQLRIAAAGGLDQPTGALGTDADRVLRAVEDVWSEDGVLVLMDLGSAVLSAELAVDLLDVRRRASVLLTEAPLVEGTVAAAVAAGLGEPLATVAAAARAGLAGKTAQLAGEEGAGGGGEAAGGAGGAAHSAEGPAAGGAAGPAQTISLTLRNPHGLHARPAALLVRTAAGFDAAVTLTDTSSGRGPVSASSLSEVATLGARRGNTLVVAAAGPQAAEALAAVRRLADDGFGELGDAGGSAPKPGGVGSPEPAVKQAAAPPAPGSVLTGIAVSPGVATGPARHLERPAPKVPGEPSGEPASEWAELERALRNTAEEILQARAAVVSRAGAQDAAIFDAHLLFLEDEALLGPARDGVFGRRQAAARAWAAAVAGVAAAWDSLDDPYQRARAADLRAVAEQVLGHLAAAGAVTPAAGSAAASGADRPGAVTSGPGVSRAAGSGVAASTAGVLVADDLTPAQVAGLDPAVVAGISLARGGPTAHAAILARALGLPAVAGAGPELLAVAEGTMLALDGAAGTVAVDPPPEVIAAAERRRGAQAREAAAARAAAAGSAVTRDGVSIPVEANIGGPRDAPAAVAAGADGVGLLRTEFLFLGAAALPDEDDQAAAYEAVAAALGGRSLTVRTLDAGADKPLPHLGLPPEANPALGVRGLRLSLAWPEQLRRQLRAVLRVAARHPVRVLFPMVATVDELRQARELLDEARASLTAEGTPVPAHIETGIMLEVPSAALLAEKLAPLVDFFSVGTNDLTQYTLAAERGNAGVAALADPLHPAVLRLIRRVTTAAAAEGRAVAVCGEVAGDPLAVSLLLGLGVRELSMGPAAIPAAKQAVRAADTTAATELADEALAADSAAAVRKLIKAAASA